MHVKALIQTGRMHSKLLSTLLCLGISSLSHAAVQASLSIDGQALNGTSYELQASTSKALQYTGGNNGCTDVEWFFKKTGTQQWVNFDHDNAALLSPVHRAGQHQLKLTVKGYDGRYFFNLLGCNRSGQYAEKVVTLNVSTPGYTQTKNPVMLVPGVMAWDDILGMEYFYRVADEIRKTSDQPVADVSLAAWQNTEDRGADLANKILDFLIIHDAHFFEPDSQMKVNLIAHSHGSTTSRMAINILSKAFGELDNRKVASLTTVAGPHYGTPTADGAIWALENWGEYGKFLEKYVVDMLIGDVAGGLAALLSGHAGEYPEQDIMSVLKGFTQKGMARFNSCYPSVGVPTNGQYFIEAPLEGNSPLIPFPKVVNGQVEFTDCVAFGFNHNTGKFERSHTFSSGSKHLNLASKPDDAFGANTTQKGKPSLTNTSPVYGDGLGTPKSANDPHAIRYFSFTGSAPWNTQFGFNIFAGENPTELSDVALLVMSSLFPIPGERTTKEHFWTWLGDTGADLISGTPVERTKGYTKASDAFIPVESTPFGQHIGTFQNWNHIDEHNSLFGLIGAGAVDPLQVYRTHLNRLQQGGL